MFPAAGTGTVGSNQPLENVAAGQVVTVSQADLSSSTSASGGTVGSSAGSTFKPLAG